MRGRALGAALALSLLARGLPAQQADEPSPLVRYGKWGATALFATFTALGAMEHDRANSTFEGLRQYCISTGPCILGPDGAYTNPVAEARYQAVIRGDRQARLWFVGGQIALGGAAALFVLELLHEHGEPNIPYSGLVVSPGPAGTTRVGWRINW